MPRYYFHSRTGAEYVPDERGIEFPDLNEAREEALRAIREMIGEAVAHSEGPATFEIANEAGEVLATVTPSEALADNPELAADLLKRPGFFPRRG
jgi:hypothetical protein